MNTQLVDSIIQVIRSLPEAEQKLLVEQLNQLFDFSAKSEPSPLQGTVLRYDDPFEPAVPAEDWEALNTETLSSAESDIKVSDTVNFNKKLEI